MMRFFPPQNVVRIDPSSQAKCVEIRLFFPSCTHILEGWKDGREKWFHGDGEAPHTLGTISTGTIASRATRLAEEPITLLPMTVFDDWPMTIISAL